MKMNLKRTLIILVLTIGTFLIGASAVVASENPSVWMVKGFVEEQNEMFVERVNEFAKEKGIDVDISMIAYDDFFPKWSAAIQSGNVPDISSFGFQEVGQFQAQGVLEDLTDLISVIENKNGEFFPSSLDVVKLDGKIAAIPFWGESQAMYYRKDYLEKAGIASYPKTWEEFREFSKKVTDPKNGIYGAGIGYGNANSDSEWLSRSMIASFGGSIFDETGTKIVIDSPEAMEAIKYIKAIFTEDKTTPPAAMGWDSGGNNNSYISGQSAFVFNTGSILKAMRNDRPDLLEVSGIAPIPAGPAGRYSPGIVNCLGIFKDAKNKEFARELMVFLLEPEWYASWIEASAPLAVPVLKALVDEPVWQDEYNRPFIETMEDYIFLGYKGSFQPAAGEIANLRLLNNLFAEVISKNVPIEEAITEFAKEAEKVLNK
jgi:multiple sugar transport system substrate-binding protein